MENDRHLLEQMLATMVRIESALDRVETALRTQQDGTDRMTQHIDVVEGVYRVIRRPLEVASSFLMGTSASLPRIE